MRTGQWSQTTVRDRIAFGLIFAHETVIEAVKGYLHYLYRMCLIFGHIGVGFGADKG
jgi:hypothetical protein